jgi:hypothetical protein
MSDSTKDPYGHPTTNDAPHREWGYKNYLVAVQTTFNFTLYHVVVLFCQLSVQSIFMAVFDVAPQLSWHSVYITPCPRAFTSF